MRRTTLPQSKNNQPTALKNQEEKNCCQLINPVSQSQQITRQNSSTQHQDNPIQVPTTQLNYQP
jgi:hypothetical protein